MDALYATLALDKKTVVLGRYAFMFAMNLCAILFSLVVSVAGALASSVFGLGFRSGVDSALAVVASLCVVTLFIQSLQLPMFFKLGYTKAKFFTLIPFIALMVGTMVLIPAVYANNGLTALFSFVFEYPVPASLFAAAAIALMVFVSYKLSVTFYTKREF
jgi:hypothetical protein